MGNGHELWILCEYGLLMLLSHIGEYANERAYNRKDLTFAQNSLHSPSICQRLQQIRNVRKSSSTCLRISDNFRKRLLHFSDCCECCHSPSIFVSIRKHLVTLVRHSEAYATFQKHLQGAGNVRRFPFLANVLPLFNSRKQWAQRHIHSVFILIAASLSNIRIIRKKMATLVRHLHHS